MSGEGAHRTSYKQYILPSVQIKDYNNMAKEQNFFNKPVKNDSGRWLQNWLFAGLYVIEVILYNYSNRFK